jgi:hypothetical protein
VRNIGISYGAVVTFTSGAVSQCTAFACYMLDPGNDLRACVFSSFLKSVTVPTVIAGVGADLVLVGGGDDCSFDGVSFVDPDGLPEPPPPGLRFPWGVLQLGLDDCIVGATVRIEITIDDTMPIPPPTWFKNFGNGWSTYPSVLSGSTFAIDLTDGGAGDADGEANGVIVDPGGPAVDEQSLEPKPVPLLGGSAARAILLLLLVAIGGLGLRRQLHRFRREG